MVCDCPFEANSPMGLRKHPRRELEIAARMLEQMGFANWQCASPVDSLMNRSEERSWTHPEFKNHLVGRVAFVQDQKYAQQQQRISHLTRGKAFSVMVHLTRQNRLFFGSFDTGMSKIASNFQRSGQSDPSVSTLFLHWVTQAAPGLLEQARHTLCCSACRLLQYSYGYEDGNGECAFSKTDRRCWQKSKMVSWGQQYVDSIKYIQIQVFRLGRDSGEAKATNPRGPWRWADPKSSLAKKGSRSFRFASAKCQPFLEIMSRQAVEILSHHLLCTSCIFPKSLVLDTNNGKRAKGLLSPALPDIAPEVCEFNY